MSIIRTSLKVALGAAVGVGVAAAVNPEARRAVITTALGVFDGVLERAGAALAAGRHAAQMREAELGQLLAVETPRRTQPSEPAPNYQE